MVVSLLAVLALAAVRAGARAMADGPVPSAPAAPVATVHPTDVSTPEPTTSTPEPSGSVPSGEASRSVSALPDPVDPAVAGLGFDRGSATGAPDWAAVLATIDAGRQAALSSGDATGLATWVDPGGPAWASDAALAARVTAAGAQIEGGALVVLEVRPRRVTASDAVLLVRDRREAYSVVTAAGRSDVAARAPRWWQVTLRRTTGSDGEAVWRIRDARAIATPTGVPSGS